MDSSDDQAASIEASSEGFLPEADDIIEASWAANEHSKFSTYLLHDKLFPSIFEKCLMYLTNFYTVHDFVPETGYLESRKRGFALCKSDPEVIAKHMQNVTEQAKSYFDIGYSAFDRLPDSFDCIYIRM